MYYLLIIDSYSLFVIMYCLSLNIYYLLVIIIILGARRPIIAIPLYGINYISHIKTYTKHKRYNSLHKILTYHDIKYKIQTIAYEL